MIVVKVELVPFGIGDPREIGRMVIANDGTQGNGDIGNYDVRLARRGQTDDAKIWKNPTREGRVEGHRRNAEPIWSLVGKALRAVGF